VLLVDDNPQHRIPLLRALRDQGHSVLHAADGPSGEALCRASRLERPEEARRAYACGYAVIQEPFTPEELCRRLTGLLGSAGSGACTHTRPDGEHRLMPHEGEALPIGSKKDN
jgi:DNA-binding response OmpR family regulator